MLLSTFTTGQEWSDKTSGHPLLNACESCFAQLTVIYSEYTWKTLKDIINVFMIINDCYILCYWFLAVNFVFVYIFSFWNSISVSLKCSIIHYFTEFMTFTKGKPQNKSNFLSTSVVSTEMYSHSRIFPKHYTWKEWWPPSWFEACYIGWQAVRWV